MNKWYSVSILINMTVQVQPFAVLNIKTLLEGILESSNIIN